jgi:hypothetical protein
VRKSTFRPPRSFESSLSNSHQIEEAGRLVRTKLNQEIKVAIVPEARLSRLNQRATISGFRFFAELRDLVSRQLDILFNTHSDIIL